jgi:transcriptional regulator with XRE-family HTH domain
VKYKLPQEEIEIGQRLRVFREMLKIPRTVFALEIGISSERMVSYEAGRVRLPYQAFLAIAQRFGLSQKWLATGLGPKTALLNVQPKMKMRIPGRMPFREAFVREAFFHDKFDRFISKNPIPLTDAPSARDIREFTANLRNPDVLARLQNARVALKLELNQLSDKLKKEFGVSCSGKELELVESGKASLPFAHMVYWIEVLENMGLNVEWLWTGKGEMIQHGIALANSATDIIEGPADLTNAITSLREQAERLFAGLRAIEADSKKGLTEHSEVRKVVGMESPMKDLLARLAQATKARGKKAALAKFLKIPASRISEWLHGSYEPSGEITLRLLEWVQAGEAAQQKSPGDVTSAAKGKTRSTQSNYEKEKRIRRGQ